ncbi:hypothetical protein [Mucilaginibacter pedocola]|uniref:Uncharacterized protein n=1 Tax=Mucilaginibacter pedocola TaxID=1792845 RepID=A0A1S9PHW2_9SPHI|nr:hypothetical protein [Mucilaginibacter pedocola]OOQ60540.1 hypothetical protein BC343_24940 [Mucilaginibacter pedocola]
MIEVFKTNVCDAGQSAKLIGIITTTFNLRRVNFELEDCDKVLRIEGAEFCPWRVIELLKLNGHHCEVLI